MNAVCFGQYRVRDKIARFDRRLVDVGKVVKEGAVLSQEGIPSGVCEGNMVAKNDVEGGKVVVSMGDGSQNGVKEVNMVTLGEVAVPVREGKAQEVLGRAGKVVNGVVTVVDQRREAREVVVPVVEKQDPVVKKLTRMYRSTEDDLKWARSGVLAKVVNDEVISVIQNRVEDAGFVELDIIPLGADRVFLRSTNEKETFSVLEEAKEFFNLLFTNFVRWNKEVVPF